MSQNKSNVFFDGQENQFQTSNQAAYSGGNPKAVVSTRHGAGNQNQRPSQIFFEENSSASSSNSQGHPASQISFGTDQSSYQTSSQAGYSSNSTSAANRAKVEIKDVPVNTSSTKTNSQISLGSYNTNYVTETKNSQNTQSAPQHSSSSSSDHRNIAVKNQHASSFAFNDGTNSQFISSSQASYSAPDEKKERIADHKELIHNKKT
jgi:hypothetical protein